MTDVKRLLAEATPLPWMADRPAPEVNLALFAAAREWNTQVAHFGFCWDPDAATDHRDRADAALIVHAVNNLPAYEEALDALERLLEAEHGGYGLHGKACRCEAHGPARAALARLREQVPA